MVLMFVIIIMFFFLLFLFLDEENMNFYLGRVYYLYSGNDGEFFIFFFSSFLVVDLDSNVGIVEIEVLLSSFKGIRFLVLGIEFNID